MIKSKLSIRRQIVVDCVQQVLQQSFDHPEALETEVSNMITATVWL